MTDDQFWRLVIGSFVFVLIANWRSIAATIRKLRGKQPGIGNH
jgi:hypothetical protein